MAGNDNRYPSSSGRHNGGRGRGRFSGRFSKKKHPDKNKNNGLYVNGIFQGRNKNYSVVRDSSKDQADEMEELIKDAIAYAQKNAHLQKVGIAMKLRKNKDDFIPEHPDEDLYFDKVEVQVKDEDGSVLKDANGDIVMKTVRVVRDQSKREKLMGDYKQKYDHSYKAKDQYKDGMNLTIELIEGQTKEPTRKSKREIISSQFWEDIPGTRSSIQNSRMH